MADEAGQSGGKERDARKEERRAAKNLRGAKQRKEKFKKRGGQLGGQAGSTLGALTTIPGVSTVGRMAGSQTGKTAGGLAGRGRVKRAEKKLASARAERPPADLEGKTLDEKSREAIQGTARLTKRVVIETTKIALQVLLWIVGPILIPILLVLMVVFIVVVIFAAPLATMIRNLPG